MLPSTRRWFPVKVPTSKPAFNAHKLSVRGMIVHPTFGSWVAKLSGEINRTIPMNAKLAAAAVELVSLKYGCLPIGTKARISQQ